MISFKKVLTGFMSAAMVLTSMSIPAFADGETDVAKIGDATYPTLADAIGAAQSGDTITLINDTTESLRIAPEKDFTLDLNGKKITNEANKATIENYGTLSIVDNSTEKTGTVDNVSHGKTALYNYEGAVATLNGGTFDRSSEDGISGSNSYYTIKNVGNLTINDGVIVNNNGAFSSMIANGYNGAFEDHTSYDGTIRITAPDPNLKLTINGGIFTGGKYCVKNDEYGKILITGGTFSGASDTSLFNWNETEITGGTFNMAKNGVSLFNIYDNDDTAKGLLKISNGKFNGSVRSNSAKAKTEINGGTYKTDVSDYCADGYKIAKNADEEYVVVPETLTENIKVEFEQVNNTGLYNIVLKATDNKTINRLTTADLTFKLETEDAITYEIKKTGKMNVTPKTDDSNRYLFNFDGETVASATDTKIVIGQVEFTGYGTFTFGVDSDVTTNIVNATENQDSIVTSYVVGGSAEAMGELDITSKLTDIELKPETADLTVKISFPNAVVNQTVDYQDMKVTVSGNGANEEFKLGSDNTDVKFENGEYEVTLTDTLVENNTYTVTVSGAGYRTARYTVSMTSDKTLNFWNNVKDTPTFVEEGVGTAVNSNFLAGDIVKDGQINIYDLSAVVSYFGTDNLVANHLTYAKYDLNRDGVIDSKDVAYVLVSWGK